MLESIRNTVAPSTRGVAYATVTALAPALIAWGVLDEQQAAAVIGVLVATVTLLFAVLHSTSPVRTALYGLLASVTVVLTVYGYGSDAQWQTILAIVAPALGTATAAAKTPTIVVDEIMFRRDGDSVAVDYIGEHRLED
ncbi:phage holin [Corynebacterium sp. H113]|uniref:phage holin n=1 Tax=Corynebacterium sp. H113 TaxID=3133419 RepID=UPI0030A458BD